MEKKGFADSGNKEDMCKINPKNCPDGLAFSMWAMPYLEAGDTDEHDVTQLDRTKDKIFMTTGILIIASSFVIIFKFIMSNRWKYSRTSRCETFLKQGMGGSFGFYC